MFAAGKTTSSLAQTYVDDVFSPYLYTGNSTSGGTQTITTNVDLSTYGGMVWIKGRSAASDHILTDTVRGAGTSATASKALSSDLTSAESLGGTSYDYLSAFSTTGFTVKQGGTTAATRGTNYNAVTYAAWTFRKQAKFFDVVTWTGNGTNRTSAHSLDQVPGCIMVKRTDTTADWQVYHRSLSNTEYLVLNTTAAKATGTTRWNSTTATATDFSLGTDTTVNASGGTYVAYLFSHDTATDGLIQCGSYTGNGSATGPTVTLGWEPQWLLIKNASGTGNWVMLDVMRGLVVGTGDAILQAESSAAEVVATADGRIDPTATGFNVVTTSTGFNTNGSTYIYIAIRRPNKPPTSGTQVFQPTVYTGTNVDNRLVNTTIAPDMVWVRQRNDAVLSGMVVGDRLRGQPYLLTGSIAAEVTSATALDQQNVIGAEYGTAFSAMNGFWVGTDATAKLNVNTTASNHIAEAFKRAPGFFDVVCYTGDGTNNRNVPHNLGVSPEFVIIKCTNTSGTGWRINHEALNTAGGQFLQLQSIGSIATQAGIFGTGNTTTTFGVGLGGSVTDTNYSTYRYAAYLFATKAGISKVFSYTGNGSSQTINCGFAAGARFVLIKRTDSTGDWYVWDSTRGIVAGNDPHLSLNTTAAEVTTDDSVDADSTGFIVNQLAATNINVTSATYIGLAFA